MTNGEKYKTAKEREAAFTKFILNTGNCYGKFEWLDLEADEGSPMPCPFCGCVDMRSVYDEDGDCYVFCSKCGYRSPFKSLEVDAIATHNRVCKKVAAYNGNEEK